MKKTLITLLALAGATVGADLTINDFTDISSVTRDTYADITSLFTHETANQITLAITLNIDTFKEYVLKDNTPHKYLIANLHDQGNGSIGINNNYSSYDHDSDSTTGKVISVSGLYGATGGVTGANGLGITEGLESETLWDTANEVSVILTIDRSHWTGDYDNSVEPATKIYTGNGTMAIFTVGHKDGTYTQLGGTWWNSGYADNEDHYYNEIYLDDTVKSAYIANGTITVDNAKTLGKVFAPAIPEPATATLSLLALAGLAMRRRRK